MGRGGKIKSNSEKEKRLMPSKIAQPSLNLLPVLSDKKRKEKRLSSLCLTTRGLLLFHW